VALGSWYFATHDTPWSGALLTKLIIVLLVKPFTLHLLNMEVYNHIDKSSQLDPILSHIISDKKFSLPLSLNLSEYLSYHLHLGLPSDLSLPFRFSTKIMYVLVLVRICTL
jgi:hypothetical protein